ncbi:MAG: hypothetical protein FWF33_03355 [Clostridiales bacterium]|nr:hypothetical protein [Clostridiales bacterium]
MKRLGLIFSIILIVVLVTACVGKSTGVDSDKNGSNVGNSTAIGSGKDEAAPGSEAGGAPPISSVPGHLSIDRNKIDELEIGFNQDAHTLDAVSALRDKYPDLVLINSEDKNQTYWNETWHSETSGMSYLVMNDSVDKEKPSNYVYKISGPAKSLVIGLTAPVKVSDFMKLLNIPDDDWAIGKAPVGSDFDYYAPEHFNGVSSDDLCFIILDNDSPNVSGETSPFGITITMSKAGYVSPDDIFELDWAGYGD